MINDYHSITRGNVDFLKSQTRENLMRAFAGESQARNRYTFAAEQAHQQKHEALSKIFLFTAEQEKAHAKVFYDHLSELAGESIHIDGGYPIDISEDLGALLRMAEHNEFEESDDVYQKFGEKAREEGFDGVAFSFFNMAKVEKIHGERFKKFAEWMEENKLYVSDVKTGWMCLECGNVIDVVMVPQRCPICQKERGFFIRVELAPYTSQC